MGNENSGFLAQQETERIRIRGNIDLQSLRLQYDDKFRADESKVKMYQHESNREKQNQTFTLERLRLENEPRNKEAEFRHLEEMRKLEVKGTKNMYDYKVKMASINLRKEMAESNSKSQTGKRPASNADGNFATNKLGTDGGRRNFNGWKFDKYCFEDISDEDEGIQDLQTD